MTDIFISYSRQDRETARRLALTLESAGWSVWWDLQIRSGQTFDKTIEKALDASRCVVVLWSAQARESDWVRAEAAYAKDHGKLLPASLSAAIEPPLQFRNVHTIALQAWCEADDAEALQPLLDDIEALLGAPTDFSGSPQVEKQAGGATRSETAEAAATPTRTEEVAVQPETAPVQPGQRYPLGILGSAVLLGSALSQQHLLSSSHLEAYRDLGQAAPWLATLFGALLAAWLLGALPRKFLLALPLLALTALQLLALWGGAENAGLQIFLASASKGLSSLLLVCALQLVSEQSSDSNCGGRVAMLLVATIIGVQLPGIWFDLPPWTAWYLIGAGVTALLALLAFRTGWPESSLERPLSPRDVLSAAWTPAARVLCLVILLPALAVAALRTTGLPMALELGLNASGIHTAMLLALILQIAAVLLAGIAIDRGAWRPVLLVSVLLIGAVLWAPLVGQTYPLLIAIALASAAFSVSQVAVYRYACRNAGQRTRGWVLALIVIAVNLGWMIGATMGPAAFDWFSAPGVTVLVGLALLAIPLLNRLPGGR